MLRLPELLQTDLDVVQPTAAHISLYRRVPLGVSGQLLPLQSDPMSASASEAEVSVSTPPPDVTAGNVEGPPGESQVWKKYSSIETCSNPKVLERFHAIACAADCEWVACEKVHGANFSFITDGAAVGYATRSSRLKNNDEDFMNCSTTMPQYHPFVLRAFELARRMKEDLQSLTIYGEYFGGYFPDRKKAEGFKTVQKGVAYSPEHHFYAFDVSLDNKGYVNFDDARELLLAAGFPLVASPLRRGSFADVYSIDVETLHTTLPPLLGLPMPSQFYIAEGVVIRPVREMRDNYFGRIVLKKKAQVFWEATGQSAMKKAQAYQKAPAAKPGNHLSSEVEELLRSEARRFITENRLRAVVSKDPSLVKEGREKRLVGLFTQDALEDLAKQGIAELTLVGKDNQALRRHVQRMAEVLIADHLPELRADLA